MSSLMAARLVPGSGNNRIAADNSKNRSIPDGPRMLVDRWGPHSVPGHPLSSAPRFPSPITATGASAGNHRAGAGKRRGANARER